MVFMKPCLHRRRRVIIVRTKTILPAHKYIMKLPSAAQPALFRTAVLGLLAGLATSCSTCCQKSATAPNTLSAPEAAAGWRLLWDGQSTHGWHSAKGDYFPSRSWVITNGMLTVVASGNAEAQDGGDIITSQRYSNFELTADFKLTPGCNSGIKIFVQPDISPLDPKTGEKAGAGSAIGMEFQLLDDDRHPDAKLGHDGNRKLGSFYDVIPAPATKKVLPMGEWNHVRILSQGSHVEFWLNGEKTVEFERGSPAFRAAVAASKFKNIPQFGEWADGHILLQEHGSEVFFRNIKIRELSAK